MRLRLGIGILLVCFLVAGMNCITLAKADSFTGKSKVAFVSKRNGNDDIYVINDNGTGLFQLTDSKQIDTDPIWSPDGDQILYVSYEWKFLNPRYELWVVNVDGTNRICLSKNIHRDSKPSWSPDGSKILYVEKNEPNTIMVAHADGSEQVALTAPNVEGLNPVWSPDGSKIACFLSDPEGTGIWVMNAAGGERANLTSEKGKYKNITWSPDGTLIGFTYENSALISMFGKDEGLYVMSAAGISGTWLAKADTLYWCPDNKTIAYTHRLSHDSKRNVSTYGTYVVDTSGQSKPQSLIKTTNIVAIPSWSPDGQSVAYTYGNTLYLRQSGKADPIRLRVPYAFGTPSWSSDSKRIVCMGYSAIAFKKPSLYVVDLTDGEVYQLTDDTNDLDPVWAPDPK